MKTIFDIGEDTVAGSEHTLLLEVGRDCCCYAIVHKPTNAINRIRMSTYDELELEAQLSGFLEPLKETAFQTVMVCSAFPQALLFPHKFFQNDYSALDLVYEQPAQEYFYDLIPEWQIVNAYSVPQSLSRLVRDAFPSAQFLHAYTPLIKIYNGYVADHQLLVQFTDQYFQVLLKKDSAIHLAQTYAYKTPLDVVYYLLKICYEFNLSQQDVYLILSGPVERESNLFTDLQQYFANIHFAQQPEINLPQSPHPHYFFTSLYNLAACVS